MPNEYIARPDVAQQQAARKNEELFPSAITEISPTFGAPEIPIYIYNVSQIGWEQKDGIGRPPNFPHLTIRACPLGDEYVLTGQLSHPFPETSYDQNNAKKINFTDGFRQATVMLSPLNPGKDQNWKTNDPLNVGGNLNDYGVFWSTNNPPLPAELNAARARMEATYKTELAELAKLENANPQEAATRANRISHAAANYFGRSYSWHRSDLIPKNPVGTIECPNCSEQIPPSSAVCKHCSAVLDEEKARKLFPDRFRRGPGRPSKDEEAA